jgi:predicted GNAT family N-acyltransferase
MPELTIYKTTAELPPHIYYQMEAFVRIVWVDGEDFDIDLGWQEEATHFVIANGKQLISYALVVWKDIECNSITYKCGGLGSMMTFPAFRSKGYGGQVAKAATDTILSEPSADIALLWTEHEGFYSRYGWEALPGLITLVGNPQVPENRDDEIRMMLFVSERAKQRRADFEQGQIYIGEDSW